MSENASCAACRFFQPSGMSPNAGECRRYAPQMTAKGGGAWPLIVATSWCGDYENKEKGPARERVAIHAELRDVG